MEFKMCNHTKGGGAKRKHEMKGIAAGGIAFQAGAGILAAAAAYRAGPEAVKPVLIYAVCSVCTAAVVWYVVSRRIRRTMTLVADTLQELIDGSGEPVFSASEDTLLSKLQFQIMRNHAILKSHQKAEEELRNNISETVGDLVHQLNTPVTNLQLYSSFLLKDGLSEDERRRFTQNIAAQSAKLSWITDGFSKISRLESGLISLHPVKQALLPALLGAVDQVSAKAQERGMNLELSGDQSIEAVFDRKWTEEVFFNLLDNAVKYADEGSFIRIKMQKYEIYTRVDVINQGRTIPEDEIPKIFSRFYRGEGTESISGVGIGLYLAQEIMRGQTGYLKVRSEGGTTTVSMFCPAGDSCEKAD